MVSKVMEVGENPLLSRGAIDSAEDESVSNTDLQQALEDSQKLNFEAQARAQSLEVDLISAKEALEGQKAKADAIANFGEVCSQKIKELENSICQLERCHHAVQSGRNKWDLTSSGVIPLPDTTLIQDLEAKKSELEQANSRSQNQEKIITELHHELEALLELQQNHSELTVGSGKPQDLNESETLRSELSSSRERILDLENKLAEAAG